MYVLRKSLIVCVGRRTLLEKHAQGVIDEPVEAALHDHIALSKTSILFAYGRSVSIARGRRSCEPSRQEESTTHCVHGHVRGRDLDFRNRGLGERRERRKPKECGAKTEQEASSSF